MADYDHEYWDRPSFRRPVHRKPKTLCPEVMKKAAKHHDALLRGEIIYVAHHNPEAWRGLAAYSISKVVPDGEQCRHYIANHTPETWEWDGTWSLVFDDSTIVRCDFGVLHVGDRAWEGHKLIPEAEVAAFLKECAVDNREWYEDC